ncbi:hypothetical protein [Sulfurovum sp.]|uniref:hypothetical protein n=1 Tax=Sulfurovum sp. TaxID=1969726 RepID=UPI0035644F42
MQIFIKWIVPILLLIIGIIFQMMEEYKTLLILPRMGALIVVLGILIESSYVLRIVGDNIYTGVGTLIEDKVPGPKTIQERITRFVYHIGLVWVVLGTLVWAFGDLV